MKFVAQSAVVTLNLIVEQFDCICKYYLGTFILSMRHTLHVALQRHVFVEISRHKR